MLARVVFVNRAIDGHPVTDKATITGNHPGPRIPMIKIANRMSGNANMPSVNRITGTAIHRGANVLTTPIKTPNVRLIVCTANPINKLTRAP